MAEEDPSDKRERLSQFITSTYPTKFAATRVALEVMHGEESLVSAHALPKERASALAEGWRLEVYRHHFPEPFADYEAVFVTDYLPLSGKYGGAELLELQVGTYTLVVPIAFVELYLAGAYLIRAVDGTSSWSGVRDFCSHVCGHDRISRLHFDLLLPAHQILRAVQPLTPSYPAHIIRIC